VIQHRPRANRTAARQRQGRIQTLRLIAVAEQVQQVMPGKQSNFYLANSKK
jgi:hypothetical protein